MSCQDLSSQLTFRSSGNEALDTLAFLHMLEQLKLEKRSGWIREGVKQAES